MDAPGTSIGNLMLSFVHEIITSLPIPKKYERVVTYVSFELFQRKALYKYLLLLYLRFTKNCVAFASAFLCLFGNSIYNTLYCVTRS